MSNLGLYDEEFQITQIVDHGISIFRWQEWKSNLFLVFLGSCIVIAIGGQGMIIFYIGRYATKERPINRMILVDQVGNYIFSLLQTKSSRI